MAEARIAVAEPRVSKERQTNWLDIGRVWTTTIIRTYYRTRNSIRNGMWPTSLSNLTIACTVLLFLMLTEPSFTFTLNLWLWKLSYLLHIPQGFPRTLRAAVTSGIVGFIFFIVLMNIRQYLLRILLSYRGWMYEPLHGSSKITLIWCAIVRLISGYQPSLYSCQRSLPRMPVPSINDTIQRLLESLKAVCTEEEFQAIQKQAKEFKNTLAPKLQNILVIKSWISQNYVSDWWEKYAYLKSRSPLPNNSNYYVSDQSYWIPPTTQISRAACLAYNILTFKRLIDREELPPFVLRNTVPTCMAQYERLFSTVRIPGEDIDELHHFESAKSKHIIVMRRGIYYKLHVYDKMNQLLCPTSLEEQIEWIVKDAEKHADSISEEEKRISALTTLERTEWARIRKEYLSSGINSESLRAVERSIFIISLLDYIPKDLNNKCNYLLNGDGKNIWFDKSLNLLILGNSSCGINCEHSMADAPAMAHMWEFTLSKEVLERLYDDNGRCMPPMKTFQQAKLKTPQRLLWDLSPKLGEKINYSLQMAIKNNEDLDLFVVDHDTWGKGLIKKCKISPDAFIQIALQLAYFKDANKFVQTYEASMTRMYLCGRTETVRSCTIENVEFIRSMTNYGIKKEEKLLLLRKAAIKHQQLYRDAMNGKGVDRHLFALYVVCKGLGHESEFLTNVITRPWTLSTSQTPHTQLALAPDANLPIFKDKLCPGGGFGPVSDDGYGVSYMFPNDEKIFFHISSKRTCPKTDSRHFSEHIFSSMEDMIKLFDNQ